MKILFTYNDNLMMNIGESRAANNHDRQPPTFRKMIQTNWLRNFEQKSKLEDKFLKIENIINESKVIELQILNLDIRGVNYSVNYFRNLLEDPQKNMDNIAFVLKINEPLFGEYNNAIVVYCSVKVIQRPVSPSIVLNVKRIELLDLPYIEPTTQIESTFRGQINIKFSNKTEQNIDPSLFLILNNSRKIDKLNNNNNNNELKDAISYFEWNQFIYSINSFYNQKNEDKKRDEIFVLDEKITINKKNDYGTLYLIKKSKFDYENISPKDIFNIYNQDDTDSSFPIKISKIKEDDLVSKFEDNIAILDEKITHRISRIKDLNVKKNEKDLNIKNNEKQIKIYDDKFIELKMILDSLDDKLIKLKITLDSLIKNEKKLSETDEKNKDKIVDISSEKNKLKKERDDTLKIINLIEQNVAPFREKNKILFKEIESLILDIKNLTNDNRIDEQKNNEYKTSIKYLDINTIYKIDFKVFKKEDKNNKNPIQDVQIGTLIDELKHYNNLNWEITQAQDKGKIEVIKRYRNAFTNITKGLYKNPYLLYSIFNTPKIITEFQRKPSSTIVKKYNLNEEQIKVIEKSINFRDVFYLQGPPGTGKTQTIAAISEEFININKNIVITSSTHEAINNFFDRLNDTNPDNPNILLLKYRHNYDDENFNENKMYQYFFEKVINFGTSSHKNENKINDLVSEYQETYGSNIIDYFLPQEIDILVKWDKNKIGKFSHSNQRVKKLWTRMEEDYSEDEEQKRLSIEYFNNMNKKNSEFKENLLMISEFEEILKLNNNVEIANSIIDYKKSISSNEYFANYLNNFKKSINNKEENIKEKNKFLKFVQENNLINVIGITTTSRMSIKVNNIERNLFSDYPIDLVIIDEISKSTTPEILSRIILSKKVIFAGDYKQLPPNIDFEEAEINKIYDERDNYPVLFEKYDIGSKEKFYTWVEKLYKTSFFKTKVEIMKNKNFSKKETPYQNLVVQHRFSEDIMNIVNEFYEPDEKLKMPNNNKNFEKYKMNISEVNLNESIGLIDTSVLSSDFIELLKPKNSKLDLSNNLEFRNFDSNYSLFLKKWNEAKINDFNAFVIAKAVQNLIQKNPDKDFIKKIGIIAMTRSQVKIIDHFLKEIFNDNINDLEKLNIKIDTVDNFQGREKEIIFVDLVRAHGSYEHEKNKIDYIKKEI